MASMWRQAKMYLGLGPDEDYDDFTSGGPAGPPQAVAPQPMAHPPTGQNPIVRPVGAGDPSGPPNAAHSASVRTIPAASPPPQAVAPLPQAAPVVRPVQQASGSVVRTIPASSMRVKPEVVSPRNFNDAQKVADNFKAKNAVIVNLQAVDGDLSRRIIDFSAGLCYGLGGQMEKVTQAVYMLTPDDVEVSAEDRRDLEQGLNT